MHNLLGTVLRLALSNLLSLALIIALLLLGQAAWSEWRGWQSMRDESSRLRDAEKEIRPRLQELAQEINSRIAELETATQAALEARLTAVSKEIERKQLELEPLGVVKSILKGQPIGHNQLQALRIKGAIALLHKERSWLQAFQSGKRQLSELERLGRHHAIQYAEWKKVGLKREALVLQHPVTSRFPGTEKYKQLRDLDVQLLDLLAKNRLADAEYRSHKDAMTGKLLPKAALAQTQKAIDDVLEPLSVRLRELPALQQNNWVSKVMQPVEEVLPTALLILLAATLTPIAIKTLFFFVLAPLAARRPPVQLLSDRDGELALESGSSSVSRAVIIDAAHELLVHPEFLQSAPIGGVKNTQWLLNWRFALTSLSAGMVALTRIRCDAPETIVISATNDALVEIGVLDLPAGSAVVMQPHNLVGVIQGRDTPLHISAHWRLFSLHAWLTLQLRYLAFHGPARLIVQGCRGVRLEPAAGGRAINQAATIAFSANLPYSTRRCETFAAYLLGKQELLNDCFGSRRGLGATEPRATGFFVYAEMPRADRRAGITGRGLKGLTDSALKVFGV